MNKTVIWPNQRENQIWKNFLVPMRDSIPQPITRRFPRDITSEPALLGPISFGVLRILRYQFLNHSQPIENILFILLRPIKSPKKSTYFFKIPFLLAVGMLPIISHHGKNQQKSALLRFFTAWCSKYTFL
jgi:hypothetical protein